LGTGCKFAKRRYHFGKNLVLPAFAYSGYRRILDKPIEIGNQSEKILFYQALDFIKDEDSKFNVNQWLGENLLNRSLAETRNKKDEANKLKEKIGQFESVINDIIRNEQKTTK